MRRWWHLLDAALGGIVIVGAAALGVQLVPKHPVLASGLGGLMSIGLVIAMQFRSILKEQQMLKNRRLLDL